MIGSGKTPPHDVAHIQFKSRIAFKLVWTPANDYESFVLVNDDGELLNAGTPTGKLPEFYSRMRNYREVEGSKYGVAAEEFGQKKKD